MKGAIIFLRYRTTYVARHLSTRSRLILNHLKCIWGRKSSWGPDPLETHGFWGKKFERFFSRNPEFVKMALNAKVIYETLVNLIVLNKFSLYYIWGRKSSWGPDFPENHAFWGFTTTYVSKCRNIPRCRRNMVDSAFESWCSILSDPKKIFVIRTHPEELHVLKYISSTDISTNFSQQ